MITTAHLDGYRALGFSLIPILPPGNGQDGKHPAIAWKPYQTTHATDAELAAWFSTDMSIGIVTGAISGIVVVDVDSEAARRWATAKLPYTPWQARTGRGGNHLLYRHPGGTVRNRAKLETGQGKLDLDIRADGGFIVAAPSEHANGGRYRLSGDWLAKLADIPRFEPDWLVSEARWPVTDAARERIYTHTDTPVLERARKYLAAIPQPVIGQGSDTATLYAACKLVRGFGISPTDAEALLWEWAGGRPGWSCEWIAQKVQHAIRYGTEAIGALR